MATAVMATDLHFKFPTARAAGGSKVHRVRSATGFWRDGRLSSVYVTWACGITSPHAPVPVDGDLTCCGCLRAEGRHP